MTVPSLSRSILPLFVLVSLLPAGAASVVTAQTSIAGDLAVAYVVSSPSTMVIVEGEGFSPGGVVYLAVYDRRGAEVHEPVRTMASAADYGTNGSIDPGNGYAPAGSISEAFVLFPATVFGPNGSQDPAQGYVRGADAGPALSSDDGPGCGRDLMVRAYDAQADAWSNAVDVVPAC
jgi:hypothetical protein